MANADIITYNTAAFICALFVLESGADKFLDHTAIVARRTGISPALIGLLTAGAEWEELVVVVASIVRQRSSLAVGNIVGSTISNVLGAFSLGLLFHSTGQKIEFDRSARIYSLLLLGLTLLVVMLHLLGTRGSWRVLGGSVLLALFVVYVLSVTVAIGRGAIAAPELSDSDSDDDDSFGSDTSDGDAGERTSLLPDTETGSTAAVRDPEAAISNITDSSAPISTRVHHDSRSKPVYRPRHHRLRYHIAYLFLGFLSICLSGYVLSHASTTICDELGISDVTFGVVILSVATTLPEKFIAVLSGARGHAGILVANTVGSNIFLLSLCLGIVLIVTTGDFDAGSINAVELAVMMGSTVALTVTVWFGARWSRWIGAAMLMAYIVFLVLELTVVRSRS